MHALVVFLRSPFARQLLILGLEWGLMKARRGLTDKKFRNSGKAAKKAAKQARKDRKRNAR